VELASPSEALSHTCSALVASSAPPSSFETTSGFSSCNLTPGTRGPGRPSRGVRFPFRAELRLGCPRSGIVAPTCVDAASCRARESPLLGFFLPSSTLTSGAPRHTHHDHSVRGPCSRSREGEGYQALTGAVLRVLAPLDGSGCARGTHVRLPCGKRTPFAVAPRRFAALFHAARAHWSRPSELSLPEEPYPLSRAFSPVWVRADRPTARRGPRVSRLLSPVAPTSRRGSPEGSPDWKAGTKVPWSR